MDTRQLARLFHTVRHLRAVQITNRLYRRLLPPRFQPLSAPSLRPLSGAWTTPATRAAFLSGPSTLQVFQTHHDLSGSKVWNSPDLSHLVLYNLHYFDDLNAADAAQREPWHRALISRWIAENPPGQGAGWEPYPLSLRIVNWIKGHLRGLTLASAVLDSLATQARALEQQLEYHLLANHLFANAKALVFAGTFFEGPDAARWLQRGLKILTAEIDEQILPDGGHFELSPMYHSIILEDLLDLLNLRQAYADLTPLAELDRFRSLVGRMRSWLLAMCHPDGQISFFNDAATGIALLPEQLDEYSARLGMPATPMPRDGMTHLSDSGYVRLQQNGVVVLCDVAAVGPSYQPGHAHADSLSFEASWFGQRTVVNTGTSCYGISPERLRERGTAAHSTVEIDGQDSSEVWSGFRVARRAEPRDLRITEEANGWCVECAHTGYLRLPGRVLHRRQWRLSSETLQVEDILQGTWQRAIARLHLHPDVGVQSHVAHSPGTGPAEGGDEGQRTQAFRLTTADGEIHAELEGGETNVLPSTYHPRFEVAQPSACLETQFSSSSVRVVMKAAR